MFNGKLIADRLVLSTPLGLKCYRRSVYFWEHTILRHRHYQVCLCMCVCALFIFAQQSMRGVIHTLAPGIYQTK